jgi:asparagine synthase (glutamine-hydrolysing)
MKFKKRMNIFILIKIILILKLRHSEQNFNSISLSEDEYQNYFQEYLDSLEYPTIDGFNTYLITKISNLNKFKVCLSGLGLDEIFDGYGIK